MYTLEYTIKVTQSSTKKRFIQSKSLIAFLCISLICDCVGLISVISLQWDHSITLNSDFRIMWTIMKDDIFFELEVRTTGYVGFAFTPDGSPGGSDIVIGWVDQNVPYLQDFSFPEEAGYPLDSQYATYYLMQTHYSNHSEHFSSSILKPPLKDSSGLKLYLTRSLRFNNAGVLSIGMDRSWRHIIPPGQRRVISEGQCIEDCTRQAFPQQGISIFAVMMQTHLIGREVKLRQGTEYLQGWSINTTTLWDENNSCKSKHLVVTEAISNSDPPSIAPSSSSAAGIVVHDSVDVTKKTAIEITVSRSLATETLGLSGGSQVVRASKTFTVVETFRILSNYFFLNKILLIA